MHPWLEIHDCYSGLVRTVLYYHSYGSHIECSVLSKPIFPFHSISISVRLPIPRSHRSLGSMTWLVDVWDHWHVPLVFILYLCLSSKQHCTSIEETACTCFYVDNRCRYGVPDLTVLVVLHFRRRGGEDKRWCQYWVVLAGATDFQYENVARILST